MAYSEGLSDTGELTGRGSPFVRGAITGLGTFIGGILHTLPFLIPHYHAAHRDGARSSSASSCSASPGSAGASSSTSFLDVARARHASPAR